MPANDKAKFDQEIASMRDSLPTIWWALYSGAVDKGFTTSQALALTQTYQLSMGVAPVILPPIPHQSAPPGE